MKEIVVINDLQGNPLDLRELEVELLIINSTPSQRRHLEKVGRQELKRLLASPEKITRTDETP